MTKEEKYRSLPEDFTPDDSRLSGLACNAGIEIDNKRVRETINSGAGSLEEVFGYNPGIELGKIMYQITENEKNQDFLREVFGRYKNEKLTSSEEIYSQTKEIALSLIKLKSYSAKNPEELKKIEELRDFSLALSQEARHYEHSKNDYRRYLTA